MHFPIEQQKQAIMLEADFREEPSVLACLEP